MYDCRLPWCLSSKDSASDAGTADAGLIPGFQRSLGGGHSNRLQYSCLENPIDRGAWQVFCHRVTMSQTRLQQLSTQAHMHDYRPGKLEHSSFDS